jgi:hypothetical protein
MLAEAELMEASRPAKKQKTEKKDKSEKKAKKVGTAAASQLQLELPFLELQSSARLTHRRACLAAPVVAPAK